MDKELKAQAIQGPVEGVYADVDVASREDWLAKQAGWSKEKLEEEIALQQEKFAGLLSRENAVEVLSRNLQLPPAEKPRLEYTTLAQACLEGPQKKANFLARVWQVYAPKRFERKTQTGGVREGKVCNLIVRDATGSANLVLWDKDVEMVEKGAIVRNSILKIVAASVKTANPLEISSGFTTQVTPMKDEEAQKEAGEQAMALPTHEKPAISLGQLVDGMLDVDVSGRLLSAGKASEFTRVGKAGAPEKGLVADGLLSDGSKVIRLVCWDENARLLAGASVGEAVRLESGYVKTDSRTGKLELHASWRGRLVRNASETGLSSKQEMWESAYKKSTLAELAEGSTTITSARVVDLPNLKVILKCSQCGSRLVEGTSQCPECQSTNLKTLLLLRAVLEDSTGKVNASFFDRQALELLGLGELTIDPQTALELKKAYIIGGEVTAVVAGRKNPNDGSLEATVKHVVASPQNKPKARKGDIEIDAGKQPGLQSQFE